jgi:hypothetical protein
MVEDAKDKAHNPPHREAAPEGTTPICTGVQDPYAALSPELRPHPKKPMRDLTNVTRPDRGLVYWTNRNTDLPIDCEVKNLNQKDERSTII